MHEPRYVLLDGTLRYVAPDGRTSPPLTEGLGMIFDRAEGLLLKHGSAPAVRGYYERFTRALRGTALAQEIVFLSIDPTSVTPALVEHVNRAIQVSGNVLFLTMMIVRPPEA